MLLARASSFQHPMGPLRHITLKAYVFYVGFARACQVPSTLAASVSPLRPRHG